MGCRMKQEYKQQYKEFLDSWGFDSQSMLAIEEMSELTKEICKMKRKRSDFKEEDMIEEIADVLNMVEQLEYFFGEEKVEKVRDEKIKRTQNCLENWKKKQGKGD